MADFDKPNEKKTDTPAKKDTLPAGGDIPPGQDESWNDEFIAYLTFNFQNEILIIKTIISSTAKPNILKNKWHNCLITVELLVTKLLLLSNLI